MSLEDGSRQTYRNPEIPEGINVTEEHPLKEFAWLGSGVLVVTALLVMLFGWLGHFAALLVPFETEREWAKPIEKHFVRSTDPETSAYLRQLTDRLLAVDPLPEGMTIQVHYSDSSTINAFATLGGHVVIHRGLLEALPHENALVMVLAHEIAHIRQRHVIRALGRGVLMSLAMTIVSGSTGSDVVGGMINQTGFAAGLTFSRSQEREADRLALRGLHAVYGHVGGADALFSALERGERHAPPRWLSTHPDNASRREAIRSEAARHGWAMEGSLVDLARP